MLKIVKRDEDEFLRWLKKQEGKAATKLESMGLSPTDILSTEIGWLISIGRYEQVGLDLDQYQIAFLAQKANMRCVLKARQIGFSFEIAAEVLARTHLRNGYTAVCTSYNLDDAKEKIKKLRELYDELPLEFQKKVITASKKEMEFAGPGSKATSRVISYPSKAPRGKTGDIYLDELAHCQNDKEIYNGATSLILRSGGQLTIGSTPLGRRGIFHAIHTQFENQYPGYWRQEIPWWICKLMCKDVKRASIEAPGLSTSDRVALYGSQGIKDQYALLGLEQFQQEYELVFVDESTSFFPYDLINPCATKERHELPVHDTIELLAKNSKELSLVAGFDVGRTNHPSELFVFEENKGSYSMRYQKQFRKMPFPEQRSTLIQAFTLLGNRLKIVHIDETGLGRNLTEDLKQNRDFGWKVRGVSFTTQTKEDMVNKLKVLMMDNKIEFPKDRDIISQIHSVKQKITQSGNSVFVSDGSKSHHSDKLWSIALAVYRPGRLYRQGPQEIEIRMVGDRTKTKKDEEKEEMSFVQRLFTCPSSKDDSHDEEHRRLSHSIVISPEEARETGQNFLIAAKVWKECGRLDKAKELLVEYHRLKQAMV